MVAKVTIFYGDTWVKQSVHIVGSESVTLHVINEVIATVHGGSEREIRGVNISFEPNEEVLLVNFLDG